MRVPAQLLESLVVEPPDRDVRDRGVVLVALGEFARVMGLGVDRLDNRVHQQAGGESVGLGLRDPCERVAGAGGDLRLDRKQVADRIAHRRGRRIHHAGQGVDLDEGVKLEHRGADDGVLRDGVGEQAPDQPV